MVLGEAPPLQQQPAVASEHEDREGSVAQAVDVDLKLFGLASW
jgi:hypothetical protein